MSLWSLPSLANGESEIREIQESLLYSFFIAANSSGVIRTSLTFEMQSNCFITYICTVRVQVRDRISLGLGWEVRVRVRVSWRKVIEIRVITVSLVAGSSNKFKFAKVIKCWNFSMHFHGRSRSCSNFCMSLWSLSWTYVGWVHLALVQLGYVVRLRLIGTCVEAMRLRSDCTRCIVTLCFLSWLEWPCRNFGEVSNFISASVRS